MSEPVQRDYDRLLATLAKLEARKKKVSMLFQTIDVLASILFLAPIKFFLYYTILKAINADRLVWFLFYAYMPIWMITTILFHIARKMQKETE